MARKLRIQTVQEIAEKVCVLYGIIETELKSSSQCRNLSEARAMMGWLAQESGCVTLSKVGKSVNRDVGSISSAVRRLSDRRREVPELAERMRSLKKSLEMT